MRKSFICPLGEAVRMRAGNNTGSRLLPYPVYRSSYYDNLWDLAPAGRRVIRYYLPSRTPLWVDDIALRRNITSERLRRKNRWS